MEYRLQSMHSQMVGQVASVVLPYIPYSLVCLNTVLDILHKEDFCHHF